MHNPTGSTYTEPKMVFVSHDGKPLQESFVNFLWENDLASFLVIHEWVGEPDIGRTVYGLKVCPGTS